MPARSRRALRQQTVRELFLHHLGRVECRERVTRRPIFEGFEIAERQLECIRRLNRSGHPCAPLG